MRTLIKVSALLVLAAALPFSVSADQKPAKAPKPAAGQKPKKAPNYDRMIENVEKVWGKPLTPAQKTGVIAAAKARSDAMKPIQEKFKADVAKALGTTVADLDAKNKAMHAKMKAEKAAGKPKA